MHNFLALLTLAGLAYPPAPRGEVADDFAGRKIAAPYRWMEDLDAPEVKKWVEAENALTLGYLDKLPQREAIRKRLTELWNFPRTEVPTREAGQLFYRRNSGLQKQAVLYRAPQVEILDPNKLSPDGSVAMGQWQVSPDGRWVAYSTAAGGSDLRDAKKPRLDAAPQVVAAEEDAIQRPLGVAGGRLYLYTTYQAQNGRIASAAIGDPDRAHWTTVVAETKDPISDSLLLAGTLAVARLVDVQSRLDLFDLAGKPAGEVKLPEPGSVLNLTARNSDADFFFEFTSYLRPRTVYRFDLKTRALEPFQPPVSPFDSALYETRALFYPSKDGTRVPIFVTTRKGIALDHSHPTMLYAYGGFNNALQPAYSSSIAGWLDLGGVFAVANLRGGSEYGEAWHHAGMREKKQNVFDDFIAAAEFLEKEGYTSPQHLAVRGGSNGGLLIGAVANQRPELFSVALPAVGVMDMLRFHKFTGGAHWVDEYGSADNPAMLPALLAYSPMQNVKPGCHPATLVTTADRDDRVVPSHSFKYTAALQAAQTCDKPVLIRVETAGSHGYRPTDRIIAEIADLYAFALANLQ